MIQLSVIIALLGQPTFDGLATWYTGPGLYTRSGEPFRLDMPICAVDDLEWAALQGKALIVISDDGHVATLRVSDTGNLYAAGEFYRSVYHLHHFVPRENPAAQGPAYRVVLDIPELTFLAVFQDLETRRVWAWVVESVE